MRWSLSWIGACGLALGVGGCGEASVAGDGETSSGGASVSSASSAGTDSSTQPDTTASDSSGTAADGTSSSTSTTGSATPEAIDDTYFATQDVALSVGARTGVTANDSDPALSVTAFDATSTGGGTVDVAGDGSFTYTPLAGFWGTDSFGYTSEDGVGESVSATVTVFVAPVQIPLADVTAGAGGFVLDGEAGGNFSGGSVSGAGDVNGDGMDDLIIGADGVWANGQNSGRSYVVFGKVDTAAVELSMLRAGGFVLNGEASQDEAGSSVSGAGDVNGDGMDDLIVGAWGADPNGTDSGRSYVVFGKADATEVELSMLGAGGFVLDGEAAFDRSGWSVSGAGDVNGDGMDDLIVGAWGADLNGSASGRSYLVFGKADTTAVELSTLGAGGFVVDGAAGGDFSGISVSGAGDVNGDGMDDLVIGASNAEPNGSASGRSYVVFGKADTAAVELSMLGAGGFVLNGEAAWDEAGRSVSGAGDVNGDGMDDLIIGAYGVDANGSDSGRSYVVFGKADTTSVELSMLGAGGFVLDGHAAFDYSGWSVSGAGDVNGDGMDDLIVGAWLAEPNGPRSGRSYVVFGKADTTLVELSTLGGSGFVLDGEAAEDQAGWSVSGAGDVNGDGMDDVIVGAPTADPPHSLTRVAAT